MRSSLKKPWLCCLVGAVGGSLWAVASAPHPVIGCQGAGRKQTTERTRRLRRVRLPGDAKHSAAGVSCALAQRQGSRVPQERIFYPSSDPDSRRTPGRAGLICRSSLCSQGMPGAVPQNEERRHAVACSPFRPRIGGPSCARLSVFGLRGQAACVCATCKLCR